MIEVDTGQLKRAVEAQHACTATLIQSVPVKEIFEDETVWEGIVHVFKIHGHPRARMAYAWSSPIEGSDKRRYFAVLHQALGRRVQDISRTNQPLVKDFPRSPGIVRLVPAACCGGRRPTPQNRRFGQNSRVSFPIYAKTTVAAAAMPRRRVCSRRLILMPSVRRSRAAEHHRPGYLPCETRSFSGEITYRSFSLPADVTRYRR